MAETSTGVYLVFAIDGGEMVWLASHDTESDAIDHVNNLRPDGTKTDEPDTDEPTGHEYEFAFIVKSPHFMSFV